MKRISIRLRLYETALRFPFEPHKEREETAAARSQANTARLLAENPALGRLRELEVLKDVLAGARTTFVFGSGDIAEQVRGLVAQPKDDGWERGRRRSWRRPRFLGAACLCYHDLVSW